MQQQKEYRVVWEIDVSATSPEEAARLATAMMPFPGTDSTATIFSVAESRTLAEPTTVDIGHPSEAQEVAVVVREGLVESVISPFPLRYIIADHDTEGADDDEMYTYISTKDGMPKPIKAIGHRCDAQVDQKELRQISSGYDYSTKGRIEYLTVEEFEEKFKPIKNHLVTDASFSGAMFETYGPELDFVKAAKPECVWTWMDGDVSQFHAAIHAVEKNGDFFKPGDEPVDNSFIGDGFHHVDRIGYLVTEIPAEPFVTYVIYIDDDVATAAKAKALS